MIVNKYQCDPHWLFKSLPRYKYFQSHKSEGMGQGSHHVPLYVFHLKMVIKMNWIFFIFHITQTEVQLHLFILWNRYLSVPNDLAAFKWNTTVSIQIFKNYTTKPPNWYNYALNLNYNWHVAVLLNPLDVMCYGYRWFGLYTSLLLLFLLCCFYVLYVLQYVKLLKLPSWPGLGGRRDLVSQWDLWETKVKEDHL